MFRGAAFLLSRSRLPAASQRKEFEIMMKLNIYEKRKVVKTYEADTYDLMFGTVEDIAEAVNIDALKGGSDTELIKMVGKIAITSMDTIRNLLKDIFEGITDEELKNTRISEIAKVLVEVIKFTIGQLNANGSKN